MEKTSLYLRSFRGMTARNKTSLNFQNGKRMWPMCLSVLGARPIYHLKDLKYHRPHASENTSLAGCSYSVYCMTVRVCRLPGPRQEIFAECYAFRLIMEDIVVFEVWDSQRPWCDASQCKSAQVTGSFHFFLHSLHQQALPTLLLQLAAVILDAMASAQLAAVILDAMASAGHKTDPILAPHHQQEETEVPYNLPLPLCF